MHVLHNNIKGTFYQSESQHIFFKWYASLCAFHIPTYFILIGGGIISQWSVSSDTRIGRSNTQSRDQISRVQSRQIGSTYLPT